MHHEAESHPRWGARTFHTAGRLLTLVFALSLGLTLLPVLTASAASGPSITGYEHQGWDTVSNSWTPGNLVEYYEGDYVRFRFTLDAVTDADGNASGQIEIRYSMSDTCSFFSDFFLMWYERGFLMRLQIESLGFTQTP